MPGRQTFCSFQSALLLCFAFPKGLQDYFIIFFLCMSSDVVEVPYLIS